MKSTSGILVILDSRRLALARASRCGRPAPAARALTRPTSHTATHAPTWAAHMQCAHGRATSSMWAATMMSDRTGWGERGSMRGRHLGVAWGCLEAGRLYSTVQYQRPRCVSRAPSKLHTQQQCRNTGCRVCVHTRGATPNSMGRVPVRRCDTRCPHTPLRLVLVPEACCRCTRECRSSTQDLMLVGTQAPWWDIAPPWASTRRHSGSARKSPRFRSPSMTAKRRGSRAPTRLCEL